MKVPSLAWVVAAALVAPPAFGQSAVGENDEPSDFSFGGQSQELVIQASLCVPRTASPHLVINANQMFGNDISSLGIHSCPVEVPNGGRITAMECIVRDASSSDITIQLQRIPYDVATNTPGGASILASMTSSGNGGFQTLTTTLAAPETVRRRSGTNRNIYILSLIIPDVAANAALRECSLTWNRQVSPAPAAATFADVPVGHPQRAFVEALAAAGITGGCGAGIYCPDTPVTRGQMAVFLSVALGLHFPN